MIRKLAAAAAMAAALSIAYAAPASAVAFSKFDLFVDNLAKGQMNLNTDTIKAILTNTAPSVTNQCYSDVSGTELAPGNGYTTGGATVSGTSLSNSSGTESMAASQTTWTSNTGNMGPFQYVIYYDAAPLGNVSATCKPLIGYYNNASSITLNGVNGDTFTISPSGNVLFTLAANDLPPLVAVAANDGWRRAPRKAA